jgi:hypothetical protein
MDQVLSKCGRPTMPGGVSCVPLVKDIVVPMILESGQTTVFMREIPGDTRWQLRAISSDQGMNSITNIRIQIQFPNGRYLFGGNGMDIGQFASVGSFRFLIDPSMEFDAGDSLKVTLSDTTAGGHGAAQAVNLVFEGAYLYFLQGGQLARDSMKLASQLPRYQGIVNENILAPCWMTGAEPPVPSGYDQHDQFTYSSQVLTFTIGTNENGQLVIPIDQGYDFFCRRILTDVRFAGVGQGAAPTGVVLGRLRTGTGYSLNDDFIDLRTYLCGVNWPKDWKIRGRDEVIADLQLADVVGTGTITFQLHLEGVRRRKV